ncbi:MAG: 50S ribosomal protein L17, partial [Flavobacteriales bacterium]|nr:50S ribosomal protein L17 [Flavobacteriales bacterium]
MRHRKAFNHLKRTSSHRKSMLSNMSCSLIVHKRIKTTLAKAKALKRVVEPIINRSKNDTTHNRRMVFRNLRQKDAVTELFSIVADKIADRPGGYTRIIKLGKRLGDAAEMCFIELVDFNEIYNVDDTKKKRTRRSKRTDKKEEVLAKAVPGSDEVAAEAPSSDEVVAEAPSSDEVVA